MLIWPVFWTYKTEDLTLSNMDKPEVRLPIKVWSQHKAAARRQNEWVPTAAQLLDTWSWVPGLRMGPPLSELMARKPQSSLCGCCPPSSPQCLQHLQHPPGPSARRCRHPRKRRPLPGAGESQCLLFHNEVSLPGLFRVLSLYAHKLLHYWAFPFTFIWACSPPPRQGNKIWNNYLRNNEAYKTRIP